MPEIPVWTLAGWIFAPLLSAAVGYLIAISKDARKRDRDHDRQWNKVCVLFFVSSLLAITMHLSHLESRVQCQ